MDDNKNMQNLYEVRKTVRFSLLKQNYEDFYKFDEDILQDVNFLNSLLDFEDEILRIKKISNSKLLQDLIDESIFKNWIENSFQVIKNQICTLIYNKTIYDTKPSLKNESYKNILETKTWRKFEYFFPKNHFRENYIPEEDFYKVKDSEIWYSIKFIATLIKDNELTWFQNKDLRDKFRNIKKYNPNWENFFELQTLNPFTTNRWKIDELENNYKIAFAEYEKQIWELNKKWKIICESILKDEIFKQPKWKAGYFKNIYQDCFKTCEKEILDINHLILLTNKFDSVKNWKIWFKSNDKLGKEVKELNKKLKELNKTISEMNGYKIHLLENYQTEKFSFLMQSWNYYFVWIKSFKSWENNVSNFQKYIKDQDNKWDDKLYYLDSMTFWGFKKLFISNNSDITLYNNEEDLIDNENWINIKTLNNEILETEKQIIIEKENVRNEINLFKNYILDSDDISKDSELKFLQENKFKFPKLDWNQNLQYDNEKNVLLKTKTSEIKSVLMTKDKKYFNNFYYEDLKNYIVSKSDLETLEKQYCNSIKDLLVQIKDKKYKVWWEIKDLSFLWDYFENKNFDTLEDLRNYFNDSWYRVIEKNINFESLLKQTTSLDLEIFQIKSKDMPFHKDFINKNNCWKENEAKTIKNWDSKKDLNTIYFESFFEDLKNWNKYARIWADFKVRWVSLSSKNDYTKFWIKEKNQTRHNHHKKNIENLQNRFKRDRFFIDFSINLNATNHTTEEKFNEKTIENLKSKIQEWEKIKILSLDHWESSFLTYKIFEVSNWDFSQIKEINWWNFDNFQEIPKWENSKDKKQENIQINEKEVKYAEQKVLENYITKYHLIIQDQKRERQVEEALKNFSRNAISKIKEIISSDTLPKSESWITKKTAEEIKKILQSFLNDKVDEDKWKAKETKEKKYIVKESIFYFLQKFKFSYSKFSEDYYKYNVDDKEKFIKSFPDQENLKAKIDDYIWEIKKLLEDDNKLKFLCSQIKESFDWKSGADFVKLNTTPFYSYKGNFSIELKQINNLKDWYASVLVWYISKLLMSWEIDMICLEDNLLSYWVDQSKSFQKHMWTENQSTFAQALINKLSFCLDKNNWKNYQFCYPVKATETNKFKWKNNWVLFFIDEKSTSLICPLCEWQLNRNKKSGEDILEHTKDCETIADKDKKKSCIDKLWKVINWKICNFYLSKKWESVKLENWIEFKDWDDLATYNIAKKWLEFLKNI